MALTPFGIGVHRGGKLMVRVFEQEAGYSRHPGATKSVQNNVTRLRIVEKVMLNSLWGDLCVIRWQTIQRIVLTLRDVYC